MSEWTEYTKLLAGLIAIANPLGAIPVFLSLTASSSSAEKKRIATVAALSIAVILLFFSIAGTSILSFFGITLDAFRVAGGLLLLIMSLSLMGVTSDKESPPDSVDAGAVGIVPLAIPLMAGPGSISTVIVYGAQNSSLEHHLLVAAVIVSVAMLAFVALRTSIAGAKYLSPVAIVVFNRIMGLIIAAIAVEFILDGIAGHYPALLG